MEITNKNLKMTDSHIEMHMPAKNKLPKGVGLRMIDKDGSVTDIYDPYLKKAKWKGVHTDSSKFKTLPSWKRLFLLSIEFYSLALLAVINIT